MHVRWAWLLVAIAIGATACAPATAPLPVQTSAVTALTPSPAPPTQTAPTSRAPLPLRPDGTPEVLPTPPELDDRRLPTRDVLPPPTGGEFTSTVALVPAAVLARSTWSSACPVTAAQLRYVTVVFRGFDGAAHTGELLVNATVATQVAAAFRDLYAAGFPIEQMQITDRAELDAPATGDGNNTSAFVCRPARGLTTWSAHAYGLAVDIDPFQNPYHKDDPAGPIVLPELASSYLDRARVRPGMILPDGPVVAAFTRIGWTWGGSWHSPVDLQHFSATGG